MSLYEPSQAVLSLVKECEGLRLQAYKPVNSEAYYTIGYGHSGPDVKKGQTITKIQAELLFLKDIKTFIRQLDPYFSRLTSQGQKDALLSFVYNVGFSLFQKCPIHTLILSNNLQEVPEHLLKYCKSANGKVLVGLQKRRESEVALWNN
jgi:GH24 family phage-related lysozyme (muramidase)